VLLPDDGRPATVSALLAELVATALQAAWRTGGDVDPTLGARLTALGYDRELAALVRAAVDAPVTVAGARPHRPAWREVRLEGTTLTVPAAVRLDLGATAKAWAADRAASLAAARSGCGVLVGLGGDLATAGPAPGSGWVVEVGDEHRCTVTLAGGGALATSGTRRRRWRHAGGVAHHLLDPRTGAPAREDWVSVSVAAGTCVEANTLSTAALVRGRDALPWLRDLDVTARLVTPHGAVVTSGAWPFGTAAA
jgi:FAD:protein FMN transferase